MPELSNLLKDRLNKAAKPEVHPDADLLTAYAEKGLSSAENIQVLEHLSWCVPCRDIVFLMTEPAVVEEAAVISLVPAKRRKWFLSPAFGMVAAVCAMAAGIGLVVRMQTTTTPASQNARLETPKEEPKAVVPSSGSGPAATGQVVNSGGEVQPEKTKDSEASRPTQNSSAPAAKSPVASVVGGNLALAGTAGSRNAPGAGPFNDKKSDAASRKQLELSSAPARRDYVNLQLFASDASYQSGGDLPAAPSAAPPVINLTQAKIIAREQNANTTFADLPRDMGRQNQGALTLYQPGTGRPSPGFIGRIADLGKRAAGKRAGPAIPQDAVRSFAMATAPPASGLDDSDALSVKPRAKSEALGESNAFSVNGLGGRFSDAANPAWKVEKGKLLKLEAGSVYAEVAGGTDMEFSVVTANGSDVWAGGRRAALMHSADNGATWDKISLGESGTGTVVSIAANGANIVVKTSTNQTWSSQDGGKSWVKN